MDLKGKLQLTFLLANHWNALVSAIMSEDPSIYLRPAREKQDPTRVFDSKKWLWVPDDEEGFKKGSVKSTRGEKVLVELTDGQVR